MRSKDRIISFKGVTIYIGIDVHHRSWKVTIFVEDNFFKTFSMDPDEEKLLSYLQKEFPEGNYFSAYEAGFCGFSIHRRLEKLGIKNIVINPADIPTTDKDRRQKEDSRDSKKIARSLKNGDLTAIHVPEIEMEELRSLVRYRKTITKELTRHKNRIKAFLKVYGIKEPEKFNGKTGWSLQYIKWLESIELVTIYGKMALEETLDTVKHLRAKNLKILREFRRINTETIHKEVLGLLRSIPGIGLVVSLTLLTELGNITRFKTLDRLCSYVGLIPSTNSSGEKERTGNITRRSNKRLRSMLVEASWISIGHDPALMISYSKLKKRMEPNEAIIRIAKKLLNRIRFVLLNKKKYEKSVI